MGTELYRSSRDATSVATDVGEDLVILLETVEFDRATARHILARTGTGLVRGSLVAGAQLRESRSFTILRLTVEFFVTAVAAAGYYGGRLVDAVRSRVAEADGWLDRVRAVCSF